MRKSITVAINEPCHEDWHKMSQRQKGRHCKVCDKTVFDFTNQTDEQIVKIFESQNNLCGRFKKQQLNRDLVLSRKEKNNYRNWLASGLLAVLTIGSFRSNAQSKKPIITTQNDTLKNPLIKGKPSTSIFSKTITCTVLSEGDNLPLPGVNILIKGTSIGTVTDFDGKFLINTKIGDVLILRYIGFETKEIKITKSTLTKTLTLQLDENVMGEIVVVGGAIGYEIDYSEPYLSNEEQKERVEKQRKSDSLWRLKNTNRRLKWKEERLARKLKRKTKKEQ